MEQMEEVNKMRIFQEPCYFAEAVYLLYYYVNHISFDEEFARISRNYGRRTGDPEDALTVRRLQELTRVSAAVTAGMNREDSRLRFYFEKIPGMDRKNNCCLAQIMLVTIPLDCSEIDAFAGRLLQGYTYMQQEGFKLNDINAMGLVLERWDKQEEPESLMAQLERLPCSLEGKWNILRVWSEFESHLRELTELIRPVAERLKQEMAPLQALNQGVLRQWADYFQTHTMDDFQNEMFNTTFLFVEQNISQEIWLGLWNFNAFGTWSEWLEVPGYPGMVRVAYIGASISFRFAARKQSRPDAEGMGGMLRALGGKDKLEILRRCAEQPCSAAKLAAEMSLNSGTVSRNLYGLYKLGYLETRGDGERVNYRTRLDVLEQVFQWVADYVGGAE